MSSSIRKSIQRRFSPDFSKPDPLLTFSKDDVAFTYGSKWKQRCFKKVGDDYFPLPAQWDVTNGVWRRTPTGGYRLDSRGRRNAYLRR
jgi:hypothetical protein